MDNNHNRSWNVLNWNIRGLNDSDKQNAIRSKIEESDCAIFCIQETKMQSIDMLAFKKPVPKHFNKFEYSPSIGASRGILMRWNGSLFTGCMIDSSRHHITVEFISNHNAKKWTLSTVYAPCEGIEKQDFIDWFNNLQIPANCNWMILGDFNMYRSLEDRNKAGGNMSDIFIFNEIISNLGLQEISLKGRNYTWSNMQEEPLLEQIDWCFTSDRWISSYPNMLMLPLSRPTSDHIPCKI
jgi:exonuclease III